MENLEKFIVKAKANGWVGAEPNGKKIDPSRKGSLDMTFQEGDFFYQDSFVGLTDFCGQEHVCFKNEPIWSMAYYGYIVRPDLFNGSQTIEVLRHALTALYRQDRFLEAFEYFHPPFVYRDSNQGNFKNFHGKEEIFLESTVVYELRYFGGLVRK